MSSKEVYSNGNSQCVVEFDGEIVRITQSLDGEVIGDILLYDDELQHIFEFVAMKKNFEYGSVE